MSTSCLQHIRWNKVAFFNSHCSKAIYALVCWLKMSSKILIQKLSPLSPYYVKKKEGRRKREKKKEIKEKKSNLCIKYFPEFSYVNHWGVTSYIIHALYATWDGWNDMLPKYLGHRKITSWNVPLYLNVCPKFTR